MFGFCKPSSGRTVNISGNYLSYEAVISLGQLTYYTFFNRYLLTTRFLSVSVILSEMCKNMYSPK